jgi:hypothetical protein
MSSSCRNGAVQASNAVQGRINGSGSRRSVCPDRGPSEESPPDSSHRPGVGCGADAVRNRNWKDPSDPLDHPRTQETAFDAGPGEHA